MKIEIENLICNWADEVPTLFIRMLNAIILSSNEEDLRKSIKHLSDTTDIDVFFQIGYGAHHLWVHQKKLSNGQPMQYRILKVEF